MGEQFEGVSNGPSRSGAPFAEEGRRFVPYAPEPLPNLVIDLRGLSCVLQQPFATR